MAERREPDGQKGLAKTDMQRYHDLMEEKAVTAAAGKEALPQV